MLPLELAQESGRGTRRGKRRGRPPRISGELEQRIVSMYVEGKTLQEIADELNAEGIPAPAGKNWHRTSFRSLLARRGVAMRPRGIRPKPDSI